MLLEVKRIVVRRLDGDFIFKRNALVVPFLSLFSFPFRTRLSISLAPPPPPPLPMTGCEEKGQGLSAVQVAWSPIFFYQPRVS